MAEPIGLKPTHAPVHARTTALARLATVGASHATVVRDAWHPLHESIFP